MQESTTWQELLGQLIATQEQRARLAAALHVRPTTITRWALGIHKPRLEMVRLLIKNIPKETYPLFMRSLVADFPELLRDELPEERFVSEIPAEFYARIMSHLAHTPRSISRQSMQDLILQQMLGHLDPERQGLAVTLAVPLPPRSGRKVRSLREVGGLTTPPWPTNLAERLVFLGCESLVGFAVMRGRSCVISRREENPLLAIQWTEHEKSAGAFPIFLFTRMVGCLFVASVHEDFFTKPRMAVLQNYVHLAACLFEWEESFDQNEIDLGIIPPYASQLPYFADYRQRVSEKLTQAYTTGQQVQVQQARKLVWQDLEELLLQIALS